MIRKVSHLTTTASAFDSRVILQPVSLPTPDVPHDDEAAREANRLPALGVPAGVEFHVLSFEGPDPYSRIGGLETRVAGLCEALIAAGHAVHLWFVGDPDAPGEQIVDGLRLHRWCQWLSKHHPNGVYDGQETKVPDYAASLPLALMQHLRPRLAAGGHAVVLAEEWQTADAVLHLDHVLRRERMRERARIFWNANNVFGFERIDWARLRSAAEITTVSRYMKQVMKAQGIDAVAIPNGLGADAYVAPDRSAVQQLQRSFAGRIALFKMARWDPDKNWLSAVEIMAHLKAQGARPLLIARGGRESYGQEVLGAMRRSGLSMIERRHQPGDLRSLVRALADFDGADVINLESHVEPVGRRALLRASDIVLANSTHEPFGLVGLETMAVGGIACTGCSGEDYAMPGYNALVLQTHAPSEFLGLYRQLAADRAYQAALRRAGRATAKHFAWPEVISSNLVPRLHLPLPVS